MSTVLGIEFGSTRIKSVLADQSGKVLATGFYDWENSLKDGVWTYGYDEIDNGLKKSVQSLKNNAGKKDISDIGAIGISGMMHGIIALDKEDLPLAPFQTWRNSNTEKSASKLTEAFNFNIPLRWTCAHLYQRVLDKEPYIKDIAHVTTLAGYIHYRLTGEKIAGIGEASGIFPIDSKTLYYDEKMLDIYAKMLSEEGFDKDLKDLFPKVRQAGENAGFLTKEGALFIDPEGDIPSGIPMAPPEGDAGTGMVATNAVRPLTGNVSAGTSTFAMVVLEESLKALHREIDMVTTPSGFPVAMAHANNGTTDLNAWVGLFYEFASLMGTKCDRGDIFTAVYNHTLEGDADCGGIVSYGYYSGEGIPGLNEGRPLYLRRPEDKFNLANFMRSNIYASMAAVKMGMDILIKDEDIKIKRITGHGGLFKTPGVAQRYLSAAVAAPVNVMDTADEGGAWGMAVLAGFVLDESGLSLEDYLDKNIFANVKGIELMADKADIEGFEKFMDNYKRALDVEKAAIKAI